MCLDFVQCFLKNTMFRNLDLFPSSGKTKAASTLLGQSLDNLSQKE
jgi:hypothetical protein